MAKERETLMAIFAKHSTTPSDALLDEVSTHLLLSIVPYLDRLNVSTLEGDLLV